MTSVNVTVSFSQAITSKPIVTSGFLVKMTVKSSVWLEHGASPITSRVKTTEPVIKSFTPGKYSVCNKLGSEKLPSPEEVQLTD